MFLILILFLIALICTVITIGVVAAGGAVFIVVFGDVIVCIGFIVWLIRKLWNKKH